MDKLLETIFLNSCRILILFADFLGRTWYLLRLFLIMCLFLFHVFVFLVLAVKAVLETPKLTAV